MRGLAPVAAAAVALVLTFALVSPPRRAGAQGPPPGGPGGPGAPADSFAAERDSMVRVILERLGDRRNAPAESVFKNLKVMQGMPAERVLGAMNTFSRSLGVSCRHCHVPGHWADEDKKPKEITRQMMKMTRVINEEQLAKMDFGEEKPRVGCMTCHRGEVEPMASARRAMRRGGGPGGPPPGERR